jgi:hypothetical protein
MTSRPVGTGPRPNARSAVAAGRLAAAEGVLADW